MVCLDWSPFSLYCSVKCTSPEILLDIWRPGSYIRSEAALCGTFARRALREENRTMPMKKKKKKQKKAQARCALNFCQGPLLKRAFFIDRNNDVCCRRIFPGVTGSPPPIALVLNRAGSSGLMQRRRRGPSRHPQARPANLRSLTYATGRIHPHNRGRTPGDTPF